MLCEKCLFLQDELSDGFVDCIKKGKTPQRSTFCENYIFKKVLLLSSDTYVKKWDADDE